MFKIGDLVIFHDQDGLSATGKISDTWFGDAYDFRIEIEQILEIKLNTMAEGMEDRKKFSWGVKKEKLRPVKQTYKQIFQRKLLDA